VYVVGEPVASVAPCATGGAEDTAGECQP